MNDNPFVAVDCGSSGGTVEADPGGDGIVQGGDVVGLMVASTENQVGGGRSDHRWSLLFVILLGMIRVCQPIADWCAIDTGRHSFVDSLLPSYDDRGATVEFATYVSRTRDGSVWLRFGPDDKSPDWTFVNERIKRFHTSVLDPETVSRLERLNYTDWCVLTDVTLRVESIASWHPTFMYVFDPSTRQARIALTKHSKDCKTETVYRLSSDRQRLRCDGSVNSMCGQRGLPDKGISTPGVVFVKEVNFDPNGTDNWQCSADEFSSSSATVVTPRKAYTFVGSYYHVYVKVAHCTPPTVSRLFGYDVRLRPNHDNFSDQVLIPDPSQTLLADDVIIGWRVFVKIASSSVQHQVFLQVWRPVTDTSPISSDNTAPSSSSTLSLNTRLNRYSLVGQTLFRPTELRLHHLNLSINERIQVRAGDVLGLYIPTSNPLPWSAVPCAIRHQLPLVSKVGGSTVSSRARVFIAGSAPQLVPGSTVMAFNRQYKTGMAGTTEGEVMCRHYSFAAVLGNAAGSKLVEDWRCPRGELDLKSPVTESLQHPISGPFVGVKKWPPNSIEGDEHMANKDTDDLDRPPVYSDVDELSTPTMFVILVIVCLTSLMIVVGLLSYCVAVKL